MNTQLDHHVTAEELDSLAMAAEAPRAIAHVATCTSCQIMVERDHHLVMMLAAMPMFDPSSAFAQRVMSGVKVRIPVLHGVSARERAARRRVAVGSVIASSAVAAGFAWAVTNPADALQWSAPAVQGAGTALWLSIQAVAANAAEQPWFGGFRDLMASPGRAFPIVAAAAGLYAVGLVGLRRILAEPASNAGW